MQGMIQAQLYGLLVILVGLGSHASAQVRKTVTPAAVVQWSDIVKADALAIPNETPREIVSALPGPGPRSIDEWDVSGIDAVQMSGMAPEHSSTHKSEGHRSVSGTLAVGFEALPDNGTVIPPDTYGSIGPSHAMTMLNSQVRIQSKTGTIISTVSLLSFWTGGSGFSGSPFDPRVIYDPASSRWFAVVAVNARSTTSKFWLAASTSSDPTGSWVYYEFDGDASNVQWVDYEQLGFNSRWIVVTANMFTVSGSAFAGSKMWVINKADIVAGAPASYTEFPTGFDLAGGFTGFCLQPCQTYGSETTLYLVDNSGFSVGGTYLLRLSRITGPTSTPVWSAVAGSPYSGTGFFFTTYNFSYTQVDADQLGSTIKIETNDPRIFSAVFRDGFIWCTHSAGYPTSGANRTVTNWYQINPTALPTPIVQSGRIDGGAGVHYIFPSISVNDRHDVCIGFTQSDASRYAEAAFTGRLSTDAAGTLRAIQTIKAGEGFYTKYYSGTRNRWGDYSATTVDPTDDRTFWTIQEYARPNVGTDSNSGRWGTWWAQIVPDDALPIQLSTFSATVTSDNIVQLTWSTASEVNNYGFLIERRREDESAFTVLPSSFVPGAGTTIETQSYAWTDEGVSEGTYRYRLRQVDLDGSVQTSYEIEVSVTAILAVEEDLPAVFGLKQNYPNPFNPETNIEFALTERSVAVLQVFNMLGQEVATLTNNLLPAGVHSVTWDASGIAAGVYVYRLVAVPAGSDNPARIVSRSMVLSK